MVGRFGRRGAEYLVALTYEDMMRLLQPSAVKPWYPEDLEHLRRHVLGISETKLERPGDDRKMEFWATAQSFGVSWEQFELDWAEYLEWKRREVGGE